MLPKVFTEIAFSTDPGSASPAWTDVSAYVKRCNPVRGRDDEYSDFQPGTNSIVLRNDDRRFDPTYASSPYYPNVVPMRRVRQYVDGPLIGTEFWGDFESGADGTAPEWTAMNGFLECKTGAETRQLTFVTSPTPRLGARVGRFEVAPGDQFGATSGERCEVRRGTPNGGFGTGNLEGETVYTQFSTRFLAPFTQTGEVVFQQTHDSGSTYGAPFFRWRRNAGSNIEFRVVTGLYPNSTDAGNGVNAGTSFTHTGLAFATDTWFDFRHAIYYTTSDTGWYIAEMKLASSSEWTRVAQVAGMATLPSYPGSSATSQYDKLGLYRGTADPTNTIVAFQDGYQVGHSWTDVGYSGYTTDSRWNGPGWEGRERSLAAGGNPGYELDDVGDTTPTGAAAAGGGSTPLLVDNTRVKFGDKSLKASPNGGASGQGIFHTRAGGTRFVGEAGKTYTAWAWFSGDNFDQVRIGIEWFNSGGSSISTTFAPGRALRTDFRRHYLTAVAPANTASFRIRTSLTGTANTVFWVDDVDWIEGEMTHSLFEGYVDSWEQTWPDRLFQSESVASCTDRRSFLAQVAQPTSNPSVESHPEVVAFDKPWGHWRLGEPQGTKVVSKIHLAKLDPGVVYASYILKAQKKSSRRITKSHLEGVSGPTGVYKNTPKLGEPGAIAGDADTSVRFREADSEYAIIGPLDNSEMIDANQLTVETWVKFASIPATGSRPIIAGPRNSASSDNVFELQIDSSGSAQFVVRGASGAVLATGSVLTTNTWYHLVGTWDGSNMYLYVNGVQDASSSDSRSIKIPDPDDFIWLASRGSPSTAYLDGWLDEVALYERDLSPARVLAHYTAGTRGYNQQTTGARVAAVLASVSPTFLSSVDTGTRQVLPARQFGQPTIDPIEDAVDAEGGFSGFFFTASGVARYLGRDYRDSYPYSSLQATFDDDPAQTGVLPYDDLFFSHGGDKLANQVRVTADGGETQEVNDTASQTKYLVRTIEESGAPMVTDSDALVEANWLLERSSEPRWRITGVSFPSDTIDGADRLTQALNREIGDALMLRRRPKDGVVFSQSSAIERVSHEIDFEGRTWNTLYGVSPIADDTSTGWVLSAPGQSELDSTAVLN